MKETIGILGSGDVGRALGAGFQRHGHDVMLGTRDPAKLVDWKRATGGKVGSVADAAAHGDVIIVAVSGDAAEAVVQAAGEAAFAGKLVLDATNPLDESMPPGLFVGTDDSMAERIQRKLPRAHVVKCFNTVNHTRMIDPKFAHGQPRMLIAGNDASAKKRTEELLRAVGWPGVIDCGDITGARWLEALVPLWVRIGSTLGAWDHAFQVVR